MRLLIPFALSAFAASPDGTLVVLNKQAGTATLVDLASGTSVATVDVGHTPHEGVVSRDGKTLYAANYPGTTITAVDLVRREKARTLQLGANANTHGLAWAGDRLLATMESQGLLAVVDPATGAVEATHETTQKVSHMVVVSPDGKTAYTANIGSGSMTAIDLASGEVRGVVPTGAGAEGIDASPDGSEIWVANNKGDTVSVVDAKTLKVAATIECPGFPIRVKLTPDGSTALVSCASAGEVAVVDAKTREVRKRISVGDASASPTPVGILVHPGGAAAYVACMALDAVVEIDLKSLSIGRRFTVGSGPDGLAFAPPRAGSAFLGAWTREGGEAIAFEPEKVRWLDGGELRFFRATWAAGGVTLHSWGSSTTWKLERNGDELSLTTPKETKTFRRAGAAPSGLEVRSFEMGARQPLAPKVVETIRAEIARRVERDQAVRKGEMAIDDMEAVDTDNTAYVAGLVRKLGWIDADRFGAKTASASFLMVQHSGDLPLMLAVLPEVERDVKAKRVNGQDYALLFDRTRVMLGERQRYGSQLGTVAASLVVIALEDRARVDELRKEMGLMPLASYLALFEKDGKEIVFEEG